MAFLLLIFGAKLAWSQNCTAATAPGAYGNVDIPSGGANDTSVSFTINCTGTGGRTVRLCIDVSSGDTLNGTGTAQAMVSGSKYLLHDIHSDAARTTQWGAWGGGTFLFSFGSGGVQRDLLLSAVGTGCLNLTMYGRIAAA